MYYWYISMSVTRYLSLGRVIVPLTGWSMNSYLTMVRVRSSPKQPDSLWSPSSFMFNGNRSFFPSGVKQPSSETFPSPPSISGLKNKRRYRFAPFYDFTSYTRTTFLHCTLLLNACGPHLYRFSDTFVIHYFRFK